jgi:hypothetical protein
VLRSLRQLPGGSLSKIAHDGRCWYGWNMLSRRVRDFRMNASVPVGAMPAKVSDPSGHFPANFGCDLEGRRFARLQSRQNVRTSQAFAFQ